MSAKSPNFKINLLLSQWVKYLESQAKTSGRTVCYWWAVNVKVISELHRLHCFFCQSRPCLSVLLVKCYYNTVYKCETFVSNLSRQTLIVWESHSNPFDYVTLTHFATHFHNFVTFIITYLQWLFRGFRLPLYFSLKSLCILLSYSIINNMDDISCWTILLWSN